MGPAAAAPSPPARAAVSSMTLDRLWIRAADQPGTPAFVFWEDGRTKETLSWSALDRAGRAIAAQLAGSGVAPGDPVVMVYAPGLDFVRALVGAMYRGAIPVPVAPPNPWRAAQELSSVRRIAEASGARVLLSHGTFLRPMRLGRLWGRLTGEATAADLTWVDTTWARGSLDPIAPSERDVALLQYTSGSTTEPRGVAITHGNLADQLEVDRRELGIDAGARLAMWVPHFHDFGLISGILSALHNGCVLHFMSPASFVARPASWLELMHEVRATHTAAPTFAYDLALRKTEPEQRARWDLSSLRVAMVAAEPVRPATMRAFFEAFAASRLDPRAMCAAYGLAEHTVGVSRGGSGSLRLDREELARGIAAPGEGAELQSCGKPSRGVQVRIVDPESRRPVEDGRIGEIWIDGPSKASGYWKDPEATRQTFEAKLATEDDQARAGRWLRTGDLGLLHQGELYVTGRRKDLIIVRGRNLYPQDLEEAARRAHPAVRPGGIAAFSVAAGETERPMIAAEIREGSDPSEVASALRREIARSFDTPCDILLLMPGSVPKTTSGKVRRSACRGDIAEGRLSSRILYRDMAQGEPKDTTDARLSDLDPAFLSLIAQTAAGFGRAAASSGARVFHRKATTLSGTITLARLEGAKGLLGSGDVHRVLVRFANGLTDDDAAPDNRGATMRVLKHGADGDLSETLWDLALTTGERFVAGAAEDFVRWTRAEEAERRAWAEREPRRSTAAWEMFRAPSSYAACTYYSKTAHALAKTDGERYARWRLRAPGADDSHGRLTPDQVLPTDRPSRLPGDSRSATFLHEELRERLAGGSISLVLEAQLAPAGDRRRLDATLPWDDLPWQPVAQIDLDGVADERAVEALQFNARHTPPGVSLILARDARDPASLEHLRSIVYEVAAARRLGRPLQGALAEIATPEGPKPRRRLRVAVVGGGASGLTAALRAHEAGHQVTVFEEQPDIAGKCASRSWDGRAYDMGGHLATAAYVRTAALVGSLGLEIEPATITRELFVEEEGRIADFQVDEELRSQFLRYSEWRSGPGRSLSEPGFADAPAGARIPLRAFLDEQGLARLGEAIGPSYTSTGYGYMSDPELPAFYFLRACEQAGLLSQIPSDLPRYWTIRGGMQRLWDAVRARLPDVRTQARVSAVERREVVRVRSSAGIEEFDRVVMAVPTPVAQEILDLTLEERDLLGQVRHLRYFTVVTRARGLPTRAFYVLRPYTDDPAQIGAPVAFHHRYEGDKIVLFYSYASPDQSAEAIAQRVRQEAARLGGVVDEVLEVKEWPYFPHVSSQSAQGGFYERFRAIQGKHATLWVGSLFNFELIEPNIAWSERIVREHLTEAREESAARGAPREAAPGDIPLLDWMIAQVGSALGREASGGEDLLASGLDSVALMSLVAALSDRTGAAVSPGLLQRLRTIEAVAAHLSAGSPAPETEGGSVDIEPAQPPSPPDLDRVRSAWRSELCGESWPGEDLFLPLIRAYVAGIGWHPEAEQAFRSGPCLYLANHQTGLETPLFTAVMGAYGGRPIVALAKREHARSWLGSMLDELFSWPGVRAHSRLVYFDRAEVSAWEAAFGELTEHLVAGRSAIVHVEGTRALQPGQPVRVVNPAVVDLAVRAGVPVVPVRVSGGLPLQGARERLEFPAGAQTFSLGRPLRPEQLAALGHQARVDLVRRAIDGAGPPLREDAPGPRDEALRTEADAWAERRGVDPSDAALWCALGRADPPSQATQALRAIAAGEDPPPLRGEERRWVRQMAWRMLRAELP